MFRSQQSILIWFMFGCCSIPIVIADDFPTTIERCPYGDNKCMAKTITKIFAQHSSGIPEIGLGSLDPFHIPVSTINGGGQAGGPIQMNITMKNITLTGWKKLIVKNVKGFEKDPRTSPFIIDTFVPVESLVGKYKLNGRILVLPVNGRGMANVTFENINMKVTLHTSVHTKQEDNEEYLRVKSVTCVVNAKRMIINFTNLFNDAAISDNLNSIINQNYEVLIQEFRPSVERSFETILNKFIPPVFEKLPYRMWFSDGENEQKQ